MRNRRDILDAPSPPDVSGLRLLQPSPGPSPVSELSVTTARPSAPLALSFRPSSARQSSVVAAHIKATRVVAHLKRQLKEAAPRDKVPPGSQRPQAAAPASPEGEPQIGNCQGPLAEIEVLEAIVEGEAQPLFVFGADPADDRHYLVS